VNGLSRAAEFPVRTRAVVAYALLATVLMITVVAPIATIWWRQPITIARLDTLDLFFGQFLLALFLAAWFSLQDRAGVRAFLHLPAGNWPRRLRRGMAVGLAGWVCTLLAMAVLATLARSAGVEAKPGFSDLVVWMATRPLALRLTLIFVAMVVEEAFFRAFLQPRFGVVPATLCFALSHVSYGSPVMGGGVFVIGLVLARTFDRYKDLAVCAIAHGVFDGVQLLVVLPLVASHLQG
jgi:membrane protease YdiL (CAAX protease family)